MTDVFLSYSRSDEQLARKIAQNLTSAGFDVWWDTHLLPHNSFAEVIERELRAARAVLVIWSDHAVISQWVRAEAELAREHGKLIQVAVDSCSVPLPFNQYQIANLRGWKGGPADSQWQKIISSVAELTAKVQSQAPPERAQTYRTATWLKLPWWDQRKALILAAVVMLAFGGFLFARMQWRAPSRGSRIAVQVFQPIGGLPALQDFSASISGTLQNVLTQDQLQTVSPSEAASITGPEASGRAKALGVGLVFSGTVESDAGAITTKMRLDDPLQHATLWTAEISGPVAKSEQLQARAGALTVAVLNCSAQALSPKNGIADPAVLQTFLHACDLAETSDHGMADERAAFAMLDAMRQVSRGAPDFAAGHSILAKHVAFLTPFSYFPADQKAALRKEAAEEAHRALEIDPKDPDAFVALGLLERDFARAEYYYRQALASNPSWPHANGFLGNVMTSIGQLEAAATLYARAASVNPESQDWSQMAAEGQIWTGRTQEADAELASFAVLWPDNIQVWHLQFQSMVAQRRWDDALAAVDRATNLPGAETPKWAADWRALLLALKTSNPAAREALRKQYLSGHEEASDSITRLGMLGFIEDAFAVAKNYVPGDDDSTFLFAPESAPLRRDPRFIGLAAKFGLVRYWQKTGRWPDFCGRSDLPYNCRRIAARLSSAAA